MNTQTKTKTYKTTATRIKPILQKASKEYKEMKEKVGIKNFSGKRKLFYDRGMDVGLSKFVMVKKDIYDVRLVGLNEKEFWEVVEKYLVPHYKPDNSPSPSSDSDSN